MGRATVSAVKTCWVDIHGRANKVGPTMSTSDLSFRLFVYGTLKRGGRYHARYCSRATRIRAATVVGRLYELNAGFPTIEIPQQSVLAGATVDPARDAERALRTRVDVCAPTEGRWTRVYGELIEFPDPTTDVGPIDVLEDFVPGRKRNLYKRVLAPVETDNLIIPAWLYIGDSCLLENARFLEEGVWNAS